MTQGTLDLAIVIYLKTENTEMYNQVNKKIHTSIMEEKHDSFHLHKKPKELHGISKIHKTYYFRNSYDRLLTDLNKYYQVLKIHRK